MRQRWRKRDLKATVATEGNLAGVEGASVDDAHTSGKELGFDSAELNTTAGDKVSSENQDQAQEFRRP